MATELAKGLSRRGHKVHFVSYARPQRLDSLETDIRFHEVSVNVYPLFQYPPYDLALASHMVNMVKYEKVELFHVHYAIPHATSAFLAKQILGQEGQHIPIITTLHGTDITIVGSDSSYTPVVEFSINQSNGVTAVSDYLKNETNRRFDIEKDIEVIPNFVETREFRRKDQKDLRDKIAPNGEHIITHVSNFRKVKRVDDVVSVFHRIVDSGMDAQLLLVGDGPERQSAERQCRELGVCDRTWFMGKQERVEELLSVSDLFLMPSGSETFGLAALEAMACGVPVISSNIGGLPELNRHGETGYLCELGDIIAMGDYAIKALGDPALHEKLAGNARRRAEEFERDRVVALYEQHYMRIAEQLKVET